MQSSNWNDLLIEFRELGGVAENICLRNGEYGRGVFPIEEKKQSLILVPESLLIETKDVFLENGEIRIKESVHKTKKIIDFFYNYQRNFGWATSAKKEKEDFENELKTLPKKVLEFLAIRNILNLSERHKGRWEECILKVYIDSRSFKLREKEYIVPILELVNHSSKKKSIKFGQDNISTIRSPNERGEILMNYGLTTPLQRLFQYGFLSSECYSFAPNFIYSSNLILKKITCQGDIRFSDELLMEETDDNYILKCLPLGNFYNPEQPYLYFKELFKNHIEE